MKHLLPSILLLMMLPVTYGQEQVAYNQYFVDYTLMNPALIGRYNCYTISLAHHHQWLGLPGAPNTQLLYAQGRIGPNHFKASNYHGLGAKLMKDRNGPGGTFAVSATYAYHILLARHQDIHLSLALAGFAEQHYLDQSGFDNYASDPAVSGGRESFIRPDADFAFLLYSPKYFLGGTAANLIPSAGSFSQPPATPKYTRTYFFLGGMRLDSPDDDLAFQPVIAFKWNDQLHQQLDINLKVLYAERVWGGLSYRRTMDELPGRSKALAAALGMVWEHLYINYGYEAGFNGLQWKSWGSHQLRLGWRICRAGKVMVPCPAYH